MTSNRHNVFKSTSILTLTAVIWGLGFVAQRSGMEHVGPFFFNGVRTMLGAATLGIVILVSGLFVKKQNAALSMNDTLITDAAPLSANDTPTKDAAPFTADYLADHSPKTSDNFPLHATTRRKHLLKGGVLCGLVLFSAGACQQIGIVFTTAGKAGFLTALYIVLVPIIGIFLKQKTHWNTWVSILIAAVGLYFLCITSGFNIQFGDLVEIIGALFWAGHILVVDKYVAPLGHRDVMKLCFVQFCVSGILATACWPLFDGYFSAGSFDAAALISALPSMLYAGILSTGAGYTLQAAGQRYANPSAASIIMSLESVFSLIGGMLILHEIMTGRELLGCVLMFAAVILAQLPLRARQNR